MHYPHKISKVKRARKLGFRARMRTKNGRKTINRKRRAGRKRPGRLRSRLDDYGFHSTKNGR